MSADWSIRAAFPKELKLSEIKATIAGGTRARDGLSVRVRDFDDLLQGRLRPPHVPIGLKGAH